MSAGAAEHFIDVVTSHTEGLLKKCRDNYGEEKSLLFCDGLKTPSNEPVKWRDYILSNLACQQQYMRTLVGLTRLSGEAQYQKTAENWLDYAFDELQDAESGLLYWGGHANYDLKENRPLVGNHELKCVYPYYNFFYEVDPKQTARFIRGFWERHVSDWKTLLFNRHGSYGKKEGPAGDEIWDKDFEGGKLPIIENRDLSFINTGSDLILAGALLARNSGKEGPLRWAKTLLNRYEEIRNEETGLAGYQFNHRDPCRVRISFKEPLCEREDINETTVITNGVLRTRYASAAVTFLNIYEELGEERGQAFKNLTVKDLLAAAEHAYSEKEHCFIPLTVDGTHVCPDDVWPDKGYCSPQKLEKVPASGSFLLAYARAFRLTGRKDFLKMAKKLMAGMGFKQKSGSDGFKNFAHPSHLDGELEDACTLAGLIDLYHAGFDECLPLAESWGRLLVSEYMEGGQFLIKMGDESLLHLNTALPLVLLHLAAALRNEDPDLPLFYIGSTAFDPKIIRRNLDR